MGPAHPSGYVLCALSTYRHQDTFLQQQFLSVLSWKFIARVDLESYGYSLQEFGIISSDHFESRELTVLF